MTANEIIADVINSNNLSNEDIRMLEAYVLGWKASYRSAQINPYQSFQIEFQIFNKGLDSANNHKFAGITLSEQ